MSTLKVNNLQVGQDSTATNNLTWFQPGTPDGTIRLGSGNAGSATSKFTFDKDGNLTCVGSITASSVSAPIEGTLDDWIIHEGDTNTKFGYPGNDQFQIHTAGLPRLDVDSNGSVVIGSSGTAQSATEKLRVVNNGATSDVCQLSVISGNAERAILNFGDAQDHNIGRVSYHNNTNALSLFTNNEERLLIDNGGSVSIGDAATHTFSAHSEGDDLVVGGSGWRGMTIYGEGGGGVIQFADDADNRVGQILYDHGNNQMDFRVSGNQTRLRIDNVGRHGINVTNTGDYYSASDDLIIRETNGGDSGITIRTGTANSGLICFADGASATDDQHRRGQIRYHHNSDSMDFTTAGNTARMTITSAGKVSISSDGTADGLLTIKGDSDATTTPSIRLLDGGDTREVSITNTSGDFIASCHGTDNNTHGEIKMFESGIFQIKTGGASGTNEQRMRINTTGQCIIGSQATVDSNTILHAEKSGESNIVFVGNNAGAGCNLFLQNKNTSSDPRSTVGGLDASGQGTSSVEFWNLSDSNNEGEIRIKTRPASGSQTTRMRVKSNGNTCFIDNSATVDDADNALQINGTNNTNNIDLFRLRNTGGSPATEVGMLFEAGVDVMARISAYHQDSDLGGLKFWTSQSRDTPTERMRINKHGDFTIGGHDNTALAIHQGSSRGLNFTQSGRIFCKVADHWDLNRVSGGEIIRFRHGANSGTQSHVGDIEVNSNGVDFNETGSDSRLKKNVETWADEVLPHFKTLQPKKFNFNWESDSDTKSKGYMAQDVTSAFPEAFKLSKMDIGETDSNGDPIDSDRYMFAPGKMVPYLMKALQEEIAKREALETRIAALESA